MLRHRPDTLLSFGGYTALPLVVAARLTGIRTATHEQTTVIGLANRIIGKLSHRVYLSWPQSAAFSDPAKTLVTGNPVREEVRSTHTDVFKLQDSAPVIYITGGNQGANTINWRLRDTIAEILAVAQVIHQTGSSELTKDYERALQVREQLPDHLQKRYIIRDRIFGKEIGEAFAKADLVVSRAGANTITELLLLGKPALLIPIPWSSHNEQQKNAELVAETGLATILTQYDAMPPQELRDAILTALGTVEQGKAFNGSSLAEAQTQASALVKADAAAVITADLLLL
ncbi:MAG: UDP-N-acetylglucosamine--N-acetylmuramyl-(pentapeptide) pyrophosphoryl-undecaprenol N-acetylglucosamine transferase [candidate division WS6 bacterium OLB20]|uniref:UDP-N-acetylglucosamine--N-acetylmuramyl-(Pentapeptide) pyrophosphoryl-undecaprenol N-acetylglucosamine transferase n=1 Tax=candidate division WS6 bacterium OLB20 TaxID=1617426 RepID=A0A136LXN4_9BACT|nr:MAG: UDP-N-acetylglucosamine--N-acetylmuramyl-(pentapeptide) pyrophosphoryl-undecaprenol N-acetylglucosamine transferase [candidate division WS6 bacterium OLB20]